MRKKEFWITVTLLNLSITAFLGLVLRTKFLFPIPFIDYKNFLNAHSHFAFGGWVTLALMTLYIDSFLPDERKQKGIYSFLLWGVEICSVGMLLTFPFQGYGFFSIIFSTAFIFLTYGFSWVFIKDLLKINPHRSMLWLSIFALASLVISSVGPFTLAYILATKKGNGTLFRDAVYTYLHFQYNGFFTLSVFAIFFQKKLSFRYEGLRKIIWPFSLTLCLSVFPSLFLSLLWHPHNIFIRTLAFIGCALILLAVFLFCGLAAALNQYFNLKNSIAHVLLIFSMLSFIIKMLLQSATIIPSLGNAVFGYRPVIIGFLHLVFLGLVSFYILSVYIEENAFPRKRKISTIAIVYFSAAVILNELILLVNGIELMLQTTSPIYAWLLWLAAIALFTGAVLLVIARRRKESGEEIKKVMRSMT